jgi:signal transduction histidine kinase
VLTTVGEARTAIHDVRNLLLAIEFQALAILERLDPQHPARAGVGAIHSSSRRATTILERIRLVDGQAATETGRRVTDITAVIEGLEPVLQHRIGALARLTIRVPAAPTMVDAEPGHLEQALADLILTIADALYHPGAVRVGIRVVALPGEPGVDNRRVVEIELLSDGRSLSEAETDSTRRTIESFGGRVLIEEPAGGGSSVKVLLPARA